MSLPTREPAVVDTHARHEPGVAPAPAGHWRTTCLAASVAFGAFSAAHLIDEFVWGAPAEMNLSVEVALGLSLAYMLALIGLTVSTALGTRAGLAGLAIAGLLIGAADVARHAPQILMPGRWRFGVLSEALALGLTLSAFLTAGAALGALRAGAPAAPAPGSGIPFAGEDP